MEVPDDSPLLRALVATLQNQDLQAITDPNTTERLLTEYVGGSEEVKYAAVQRALLMASMLGERDLGVPDEAKHHITGALVGVWLEGFLTGAMVATDTALPEETST